MGSVGTLNGNRTMTRTLSASPTTSTPSQKLAAPRSTVRGLLLKVERSCRGEPSTPWPKTRMSSSSSGAWMMARVARNAA